MSNNSKSGVVYYEHESNETEIVNHRARILGFQCRIERSRQEGNEEELAKSQKEYSDYLKSTNPPKADS